MAAPEKPGEKPGRLPRGELWIDLAALQNNYRFMAGRAKGAVCAAAVKADAYGIGADRAGPALWQAGCRDFFVAHLDEALHLRESLPKARIFVLHGTAEGRIEPFHAHDLTPVLNSLDQIDLWAAEGRGRAAALHIDTGMNRLGLPGSEVMTLVEDPARAPFPLCLIMSHLACADDPENEMNGYQLARFTVLAEAIRDTRGEPDIPLSLANSAGVLIGEQYHFDMVRPGIALYGANPLIEGEAPTEPVVTLKASVLQVREVRPPATVGYGAECRITEPARLATLDIGYADGYLRAFGNGRGRAQIGGHEAPVAGRISMDMITVDASDVPPELCTPGASATLIGGPGGLDRAAADSGFSSYELLTLLRHRYKRVYVESGD